MDGSEVIVAVYGQQNVGKTTFIARCLDFAVEEVEVVTKSQVNICGQDINIRIVENPDSVTRAVVAIVLYDITKHETFNNLTETVDIAHRMCPTAYLVIIGTKADLRTDGCVSTAEAEGFSKKYQDGSVPYYETALDPPETIQAIFKEILARPLINVTILKIATVQENAIFVHDTMDWALENGSANILTHLRDLGYAIPEDLIWKYQDSVACYLLSEYPLKTRPDFKLVTRPEVTTNVSDSELDEDDEPMNIIDIRSSLKIAETHFLQWSDISLTIFPSSFLSPESLPLPQITHVDLSLNQLTSVPLELLQLPSLAFLNLSDNLISSLPGMSLWGFTQLEILDLSNNKLIADPSLPQISKNRKETRMFQKLWNLDISSNGLTCCPGWVMALYYLKLLDLSDNQIHQLPTELGLLTCLHSLLIDNLPLTDPPAPIPSLGTQTLLNYLHFKHMSSQPLNSMRVVVVGPEKAGKTSLINRLRGENVEEVLPTKGLEVSQWRYKGELLRRRVVNFDFWDFSGSPKYKDIYTCFRCQNSLHIAVFSIHAETSDIIRWLSDIQSLSAERVPILVVFTHMDTVTSREMKEELKRKRTDWLKYNLALNEQVDTSPAFTLLASTMTQAVKSLQDPPHERHSLYNPPQQAFDRQEYSGDNIPLMPLVLQNPHFVSCPGSEGISQLRKTLYRIGTGSFQTTLSSLNIIGLEVPTVYNQIESLIRQLRGHLKDVKTEGEQKPFYTFGELQERLRRPLKQLNIPGIDFVTALRFLHERGLIYIYDSKSGNTEEQPLIAINPQIIGYLLQRTIRAGEAHSESNILPGFLPNMHPNMIWGVNPIIYSEGTTHGISPTQLISFLTSMNIAAPVVPGACVIPSLLPVIPVPGTSINLTDMNVKRVYILGYLPSFFWFHLVCRVLRGLAKYKIIQNDNDLVPSSPSATPARPSNPLVTSTGAKLYLWQKNVILEDIDGSKVWIVVLEGGQLGPESTPFCGRVDVLMKAEQAKGALLLRLVTTEIDQLLIEWYPSLLDNRHTPQQVEIFIPLTPSWFNSLISPSTSPSSYGSNASFLHPMQPEEHNSTRSPMIPISKPRALSSTSTSQSGSEQSFVVQGSLQEAFISMKTTGTLPVPSCTNTGMGLGPGAETKEDKDWEIVSRKNSVQMSLVEDFSLSIAQYLVPAWECLQEVYKPPSMQLRRGSLDFRGLMPDMLYADLPLPSLIAISEPYMEGVKVQEAKGMFLRYYYSNYSMEAPKGKTMGAEKTFSLQKHMTTLYQDLNLLTSLSCPYIISPLGINFSPPVLALELSPHGSLRSYMTKENSLCQSDVHQVGLQVLSAIEYLEDNELNYHYITGENIFLWSLDPVIVKLSDAGLTHNTSSCKLCANLLATPSLETKLSKANRFNLIMFGLLLYEMSVGTQAYEGIFSFSTVILGLYYQKLVLNIPAVLQHQVHTATDVKTQEVKACHRLCLQSVLDLCTHIGDVTIKMLRARLSLCAGEESWAPLNLTLDLECLLSSVDASLVYWASGSRGLVVGTISPTSGKLYRHILAEAPTPESGLFANRRGKPIPIAVGHATAIDLCYATNQLWVGTENGLMGSVYVFNLPDMKTHHYIHLQDAVLSLMVVNDHMQHDEDNDLQFHVLVGLANGTIIKFMGRSGGQILNNPLHGPRKVIMTTGRKPCLNMHITSNGHLWCGCGNNIEIFDSLTLNSLFRHDCQIANGDSSPSNKIKGEVIVLMALSKRGVWTVSRRSTVLRLWDMVTGELRASFNVKNILNGEYSEISALTVEGGTVWMGTRNGFIMLLDAAAIAGQDQEEALKAMQYCGEGRVKSIVSLSPRASNAASLKVLCSIEYPDEVSGCIMRWEFQSLQTWQPREQLLGRACLSPT